MANRMSWAGGTGAHNAPQSMEPEVMGKRSTHAPGGQALTATRRRRVGGSTRTTKREPEAESRVQSLDSEEQERHSSLIRSGERSQESMVGTGVEAQKSSRQSKKSR
ncbi:hypothetical protein AVEN_180874-1 [Araneus ventricosus]|uniref:Uncharacterized protein n=1 Tax=Araneus ventricosus TaxID=182803 RepID=A0A4Y2V296_ARAVE|nr:hypothetical protein AVEN_180874-1 [Araneus ventricosus]